MPTTTIAEEQEGLERLGCRIDDDLPDELGGSAEFASEELTHRTSPPLVFALPGCTCFTWHVTQSEGAWQR